MKHVLASWFILLTINTVAQSHFTPADKVRMDSLVDLLDQRHQMMGTVTLTRGGQTIYNKAIGYRSQNVSNAALNDTVTRYRIGSITRMFTATMIFQLIEEGKLSLETPVSQFFPTLANAAGMTIDSLLNHFADGAAEFRDPPFVLLGAIIEKLTQGSYETALNRRIVFKVHLLHTAVGGPIDPANDEAYSYTRSADSTWHQEPETDLSISGGAGCLISTAQDIDLFQTSLFNGAFVSDSSLQAMKGIFGNMQLGKVGYGHNGSIDAFRSFTVYLPYDQVALTILTNASPSDLSGVAEALLQIYYHQS